ncbi:hypothetical protein BDD12DRAFT_919154 [Trichophaea hybrida]|nr:hypothetical protein BDD12DRAFT_919154 [Trichophaea hybrida]
MPLRPCLLFPCRSLLHTLKPHIRTMATTLPAPSLPDLSIASKVILITGGGRGLGLTQGEALTQAGATVYALDIHPQPPSEFSTNIPNLHYHTADVRSPEQLESTLRTIADKEGRIDGMIASAGVLEEVPALECTKEQFQRIIDINVTGVFLSAQACAREMVRLKTNKGGSIALVASMSGVIANHDVHMAAYNSSKAAVHQLGRCLAADPGYIMTKMVEDLFQRFPERKEIWSRQNMLGRLSTPEEYRGAAVFLMSDASSFMTGADLMMDGGHRAW